jgi:hypothetical protein
MSGCGDGVAGVGGPPAGVVAPHVPQKAAALLIGPPQRGHVLHTGWPQCPQNDAVADITRPQAGHTRDDIETLRAGLAMVAG